MGKDRLRGLSPAETEILRLVWQIQRATVQGVCDRLPAKRRIAYATVQTLLRRLEAKGYIRHDMEGKAHVFFPVVKQDEVVKRSVGDFIERLFGGDPVPLVQYLAEHGKITAEDIERIKRLIGQK